MVQERPLSVHTTRHFPANFAAERALRRIVSVKKPTALENTNIHFQYSAEYQTFFICPAGTLENNII